LIAWKRLALAGNKDKRFDDLAVVLLPALFGCALGLWLQQRMHPHGLLRVVPRIRPTWSHLSVRLVHRHHFTLGGTEAAKSRQL